MPIGNIWSGISFRHDDSIFVALAEPCCSNHAIVGSPILVLNFEGKKLFQLRMNHSYFNVLIMFFIGLGDLQGIMWIL